MSHELLITTSGVAVVAVSFSGSVLCLAIAVVLFKLYPSLRGIASNLEIASGHLAVTAKNAASISESVAGQADGMVADMAATAKNVREASGSVADGAGNIAKIASAALPIIAVIERVRSLGSRVAIDRVTAWVRGIIPGRGH